MAMRHTGAQPLSPWRPAMEARHLGGHPGLVDEHELGGVEVELALEPCFPPLHDIRAVLFGSVACVLWDGPPLLGRICLGCAC